jgi:ABC-2 type transport system ATP-binding protein
MTHVIELANISKRFGENIALDNVSYTVEQGTVFALLGENGAGKTTTIRILLGMTDTDEGKATVLGLDSKKDDVAIRTKVGYVPEQPLLYDWMNVAEIGKFTASYFKQGYWEAYCRQVEEYGLPLTTQVKSLSKGMRAKVSLALALAHNPELLILDEPTSGLDALVRREFLESMVDRAANGKTVFLSSHQIGEVERVADYVAIMKKSQLLLVESMEHLKETSHLITATVSNDAPRGQDGLPDFAAPVGTIIEQRVTRREVQILGRNLDPAAGSMLEKDPNITRFEIRTPTLEEIFIAYMSGNVKNERN